MLSLTSIQTEAVRLALLKNSDLVTDAIAQHKSHFAWRTIALNNVVLNRTVKFAVDRHLKIMIKCLPKGEKCHEAI